MLTFLRLSPPLSSPILSCLSFFFSLREERGGDQAFAFSSAVVVSKPLRITRVVCECEVAEEQTAKRSHDALAIY